MLKAALAFLKKPQADGSPSTFYLYSRLFEYIRPYLFRFIISVIITIPIGSLDAAIALSLKPYLDGMRHHTHHHHSISTSFLPLIIIGLTAVQGILNYFSIYINGWLSFHVTNDLRRALFKKLLTMEVKYFDKISSGTIIQRYFKDPESLQTNLLENSKTVLTRFTSSISLIGVLIYTSWQLSIVAIIILLLILYPSTRIRHIIKAMARELTKTSGGLMSMYTDAVGGIKVIYSYNLFNYQVKKLTAIQRLMFDRTMKKVKAAGWMTPSMHMIASIGISLIIWQGSRMTLEGQMTTGALVSFLAAMIMLYNPIKNLGSSLMNAQLSVFAATRVFEILDTQPEILDKPDAVSLGRIKQGIEFNNVLFSYGTVKTAVFRGFNLSIKMGETVAIVGNSGGGKTTIANLLSRFYDIRKGGITIDGIDIRDIKLESLRSKIAMVMQDNFLFNGTIRDNIMVGRPNATEEEVWQAVEKAYLKDFILSLQEDDPERGSQLDTEIGERGIMLSGGQRQRIAIARALLKDAPIVILDEATSALDNQSEAIVQQAMESLMENRTVIVIAHRLSTIRNADRIVVLDSGRVLEQGAHEELLAANGAYTALYNGQFKPLEEAELQEECLTLSQVTLSV